MNSLSGPYLNRGHDLYMDNWFTSLVLTHYLHLKKTNVCRTIRKNRKGMLCLEKKLKIVYTHDTFKNNLLVLKWKDRKNVFMLTLIHENKIKVTGKRYFKGNTVVKLTCVL